MAQVIPFPNARSVFFCPDCDTRDRKPVRSTSEIWNDLQNLPMQGGDWFVKKRRAELIYELQGNGVTFIERRQWWQFWRLLSGRK